MSTEWSAVAVRVPVFVSDHPFTYYRLQSGFMRFGGEKMISSKDETISVGPAYNKTLAAAISAVVGGVGPAQAADAVLEEIIVTAGKRGEQNIQDMKTLDIHVKAMKAKYPTFGGKNASHAVHQILNKDARFKKTSKGMYKIQG